ncbi:MAG: hypothetical protein ACQKBY_08310 [Verrucomicrobiales bacterium]
MKVFLVLVCVVAMARAEMREWTRESDGAKIQARLISFDADSGKVRIAMAEGKEFELDQGVFGESDRAFLATWAEEKAAARAEMLKAAEKARLEVVIPPEGGGHKVHIYKPKGYLDGDESERSRPVAFLYSPGGNARSVLDRLKLAADELGWLLVGVDAYRNDVKGSSEEEKARVDEERVKNTRAAYDWARENLIFDEQKMVFGGMSGGALWAYITAAEVTDQAAGILAFGGWLGREHERQYSKEMAVAIINGDQDKNAIAFEERDGDYLSKRRRAEVKVFRFPGGHVLAPAEKALEAARWIHQEKGFSQEKGSE